MNKPMPIMPQAPQDDSYIAITKLSVLLLPIFFLLKIDMNIAGFY